MKGLYERGSPSFFVNVTDPPSEISVSTSLPTCSINRIVSDSDVRRNFVVNSRIEVSISLLMNMLFRCIELLAFCALAPFWTTCPAAFIAQYSLAVDKRNNGEVLPCHE